MVRNWKPIRNVVVFALAVTFIYFALETIAGSVTEVERWLQVGLLLCG